MSDDSMTPEQIAQATKNILDAFPEVTVKTCADHLHVLDPLTSSHIVIDRDGDVIEALQRVRTIAAALYREQAGLQG